MRWEVSVIDNKLDKQFIKQISLTILNFILTVVIPIIGYIQFKITTSNSIDLGHYETKYDIVFVSILIIGLSLSGLKFYSFKLPQFSVRRGSANLISSILFVIFLGITAQIGIININLEHSSFSLNLMGVFIILIVVWILFILKNAYDVIDFKLHQSYYSTSLRKNKFFHKENQKLVKCPKCKYMCRVEWKKCPICNTKI